jgi:hypothetical protein
LDNSGDVAEHDGGGSFAWSCDLEADVADCFIVVDISGRLFSLWLLSLSPLVDSGDVKEESMVKFFVPR